MALGGGYAVISRNEGLGTALNYLEEDHPINCHGDIAHLELGIQVRPLEVACTDVP